MKYYGDHLTVVIFSGFPDVGQQALGHGGQRDAATPREQETGQSGINQKLFQINQLTILYIHICIYLFIVYYKNSTFFKDLQYTLHFTLYTLPSTNIALGESKAGGLN